MRMLRIHVLGLAAFILAGPARGLGPDDVFILANKNVPESPEVAEHYCVKRKVPRDHVIVLDLPKNEDISRKDYQERIVKPVRAALKDRREQARVLLSVYGVPLRVGPQEPSDDEKARLAKLQKQIGKLEVEERRLKESIASQEAEAKKDSSGPGPKALPQRRKDRDELAARLNPLRAERERLSYQASQACVDSELSLLWWDGYELRRWQANLLNWQIPDSERRRHPTLLMVSRLDGPSAAIARRLVDQAMEVEQKGLTGKVYVDARGIKYDAKGDPGFGYGGYDESLREMARLLDKDARLPVVLDDKPGLFAPGSCPDCALYCGWYSLANYVDCCRFVPGAVAYHIASSEAVSLRDPKSKLWCKCLLEHGVAATLGPVAEPYTIGFPKPAEFFGLLVTGRYTLVECYSRTALLTSWMTVLVGDPLYNPFAKNPRLKPEQVKPSPQGGQPLWRPTPPKVRP